MVKDAKKDSLLARQRLQALIRQTPGESCASLSRFLGRNHAYIQQYIRRGQPRYLNTADCKRIAARFGVEAGFLRPDGTYSGPGFQESNDGIAFIPLIDRTRNPRNEGGLQERAGMDSIPFRMSMIEKLGIGASVPVIACMAQGDSMMPTFGDGDLLLVDRSVRRADSDGIYMIQGNGAGILEKRISINPVTGRLTLRSDNPLYPVWQDCPAERIDVLGRIIWQGRRL